MCASCTALLAENEALMERYQIVEAGRYAAERQVRYLKGQLNGSTTPETQRIKEITAYHDECWRKVFPKARGLSYPMDGKNAAAVRKVLRWGFTVQEIKHVLDGAFASDFHRTKPQYLYLASVLGDENKIRNHLARRDERKAAMHLAEVKGHTDRLWPPVDRVLLELRRLDINARKADGTVLDDRRVWMFDATCPLCRKGLRVGEVFESRHGAIECAGGCDLLGVLDALHLWPSDLAGPSDPDVAWEPLLNEKAA
jgi:hypothetical protein